MILNVSSFAAFASVQNLPLQRQSTAEIICATGSGGLSPNETRITISQAARDTWASSQNTSASESQNAIEARLAKIKAGDSRTDDDMDFLLTYDKKLIEIEAKGDGTQTAAEVDYIQKARCFVNTMRNLSNDEKALYDELVAKGNTAAAAGIAEIAAIREMGHMAGGPNGTTYDPINKKITAENVLKLFSHTIIDPSGRAASQFQALAQYLQNRPTESPQPK